MITDSEQIIQNKLDSIFNKKIHNPDEVDEFTSQYPVSFLSPHIRKKLEDVLIEAIISGEITNYFTISQLKPSTTHVVAPEGGQGGGK